MNTWKIKGPTKLSGRVKVHGNKNSSFPCMAASLLLETSGYDLALDNIPRIRDVFSFCAIMDELGFKIKWVNPHKLKIISPQKKLDRLSLKPESMAKLRGSIVLLGPLIGKYKKLILPKPGGDKIGNRSLIAHTAAFKDMNFLIQEKEGDLTIQAKGVANYFKDPIWLAEKSVTATSSLLLFSAFLKKEARFTIYGAACEPHIVTLCRLLSSFGGKIEGLGSNYLSVTWPDVLDQPQETFLLDDDYIEATTYAVGAAISKSDLIIEFKNPENLQLLDRYLKWMGVKTELNKNKKLWSIYGSRSSLVISPELSVIKAEPWPGFPTDATSLFVILATQCKGSIKFLEYMYEDRFTFIQTLKDMGARIEENFPHVIKVSGPMPLYEYETFVRPDIRSGAALMLAALCAKGTTVLHDKNKVIERGYEKLPETLIKLGARIKISSMR